ncbi:uncharacterized protein MYCFIDRAFT_101602, partial [Pseudocercospora fijiensis CIRAD86]
PKKAPLTHFLCLPLITSSSRPEIEASLNAFKDSITTSIHPKAIRPVGTLHLTLGVMSLDPTKLAAAVNFLKELDLKSMLDGASPGSVNGSQTESKLDLKGLESMHPPQKTSILYAAPTDRTGRLYPFCLALQEAFNEKEFLVSDDRKLKLHATLVNTIYAKDRGKPTKPQINAQVSNIPIRTQNNADAVKGHGPDANAHLKLDARSLIDKYKDYVWAEQITLDRVAICEMGAKKI